MPSWCRTCPAIALTDCRSCKEFELRVLAEALEVATELQPDAEESAFVTDGALVAEDIIVAMPATGRREGPGSYPAHLGARTAAGGATNEKVWGNAK